MTDLCYIILAYWDLVKPTCKAIKQVVKEDINAKYAIMFQREEINFDYEPAR